MTISFDKFVRQFKLKGSEKADGYSKDVFVGLDQHEKEEVFELLLTEFSFAIEWIFFLDAEKALPIAKKKKRKCAAVNMRQFIKFKRSCSNMPKILSIRVT